MLTAIVRLLAIGHRLPDITGKSTPEVLEILKPLMADARRSHTPAERAQATTYLTEAATSAESLLDTRL